MTHPIKHGKAPYSVAVLHGGPGAGGEMAPVARRLASCRGVLEPIQTAKTVEGQVEELKGVLELPATLIGFSWGAWLGFILAARHPALVKKLILVGSGPFEEKYAEGILDTRLSRLSAEERSEVQSLDDLDDSAFARIGALFSKADAYDPMEGDFEAKECRADIFQSVWNDAAELRRSGELLALGKRIECPVVAIHGDFDPHPAEGVQKPLSDVLNDFEFILLEHCGHKPWIERRAAETFYRILEMEL